MKSIDCPQEEAVTKAVRVGNLDASLQAHAAACEVCRDIVATANWMQGLAEAPGNRRALPDASLVYWRARLSERGVEAEKAQDVLDWAEFAGGAMALGLAGWGAWNWAAIQGFLSSSLGRVQGWTAGYVTPVVAASVVGALGLLAVVLAYPGLVDE